MTTAREKLEAQVKAVNMANAWANEIQPKLIEFFRPLIGQKIIKGDGDLLRKLQNPVDEITAGTDPNGYSRAYKIGSSYSLAFVCKTCVGYGDCYCVYHEAHVYVGSIQGDTLVSFFNDHGPLKADWTAEEVEKLRAEHDKAKEAERAAASALGPFA